MTPCYLAVLFLGSALVPSIHAVHLGKLEEDPATALSQGEDTGEVPASLAQMQVEALPRGALATVWDSKTGDQSAAPATGLLDSAKVRVSAIAFFVLVLLAGCLFVAARPRMRDEMKDFVVARMSGKPLTKPEPLLIKEKEDVVPPMPPTAEDIATAKDLQQQWLLFESHLEASVREAERNESR